MRKKLTIISWERLAATGDNVKVLVRFSIAKEGKNTLNEEESINTVKVKISRTLKWEWENQYSELSRKENLDYELMYFGLRKLRERISSGIKIEDKEEFGLSSYSEYFPTGFTEPIISPGYYEIIDMKGKLGFIQ